MALAYATTLRNAMLDEITTAAGGSALLRIYDGSRPSTGGTATTLLAELTCNATFAPSAASGVLTLNAITQDSSANATGTATWFRIVTSGAAFVLDGNVGTSGSDLNLTTTSIVSGQPVSVTSFVITEGNP
jgi:choline-glycine betaine transporter